MKIKNIIIDGKLKFIHIYYKNYKELDILKYKGKRIIGNQLMLTN